MNRIELIIEGVLRVKGTQSDTVTFMSNGQVPASGDWYGIVSKGSTGKVLVDYASINHYTNVFVLRTVPTLIAIIIVIPLV